MLKKLILIHICLLLSFSIYGVNEKIFSKGSLSLETLSRFLSYGNRDLGYELTEEFARIYIEEAKKEGINWDVAFAQMCLETGFLKFGGLVEYGQNNFCGLGSFDNKQGASFPTIREGVRAHVQHLKAYSSTEELVGELLDPRFHLVQRGSALYATDLSGRWATDPNYGVKIVSLLKRVKSLEDNNFILKAESVVEILDSDTVETLMDKESDSLETRNNEVIDSYSKEEVALVTSDSSPLEGGGWLRDYTP